MTGNFTLFSTTAAPVRSTYTLTWNETNSFIDGSYSDNVFAASSNVSGVIINDKRVFQVVFSTPDPRHGVKSLTIEAPDDKGMNPNVTATVVAKNLNGVPMQSTSTFASINLFPLAAVQAQEEDQSTDNCSMGFGALTGFCGLYSGNMSEGIDPANVCQLSGARLELATNGDLSFYFNYNGTLRGIPRHSFGSLLGTPMDPNINSKVSHCGPLPGTTMNSLGCKTLHLVGSFQDFGGLKNFTGTYDIRDEVTGNRCGYSLSLGRDAMY